MLDSLPKVDFFPDVIHCNDWQTGLIPALLKMQYANDPDYAKIKTVYTIHNLRFQGLYRWDKISSVLHLDGRYFTPDGLEFYGLLSFMKGGIIYADRITTVSPTYAEEICMEYYGERLDGLLRARKYSLSGILNGIDTHSYDPHTDLALPEHHQTADQHQPLLDRDEHEQREVDAVVIARLRLGDQDHDERSDRHQLVRERV